MKICFPPSAIFALSVIVLIPLSIPQSHAETPTERAQWKTKIQWPDICEKNLSSIIKYSSNFVGVDVYPWKNGQRLISVLCERAAYSQGELFFLESPSKDTPNKFYYTALPFIEHAAITDSSNERFNISTDGFDYFQAKTKQVWGNTTVDSKAYTITNRRFYRGSGGCGTLTTYTLENDQPVISELRMKTDCDETMPPPEEWPLFPASDHSKWPMAIK